MADLNWIGWEEEDAYWRTSYRTRPYASSESYDYDYYRPGYQYGFEAAHRYQGRAWNEIEPDLSRGWNSYEHRNTSTWDQVKAAVRDAWDRVTNKSPVVTK